MPAFTSTPPLSGTTKLIRAMDFVSVQSLNSIERFLVKNIYDLHSGDMFEAQARVQAWIASDPANTRNFGPLSPGFLMHELSSFVEDAALHEAYLDRTRDEICVWQGQLEPPTQLLLNGSFQAFLDFSLKLASLVAGISDFRTIQVGTTADKFGNKVVFPHQNTIFIRLESLFLSCRQNYLVDPAFAAVALLCGIQNIHPFTDGNGRVSRILYNWVLKGGSESSCYVPIYEAAALSSSGFLIRMRQAQYQGNYEPILRFLLYVTESFVVSKTPVTNEK